ncbi:transcription repressor OFP8 [Momordica charantia]|uniref:Transcription repressor n=1 Tax=Momordica charantia TaxID=3673 RepID=A0A6J1CUR8_MOMCH|nr:transcription repressor OFP8 [Momordica charantia]
MEPRFKVRLSRMFQASFASCRSRNLSDIIHKPVFVPPLHDATFRSIRPDSDQTTQSLNSYADFDFDLDLLLPKRKIARRRFPLAPFPSAISGGRTCPPASPISPPKPFSEFAEKATDRKKTKKKKKKKKTKQRKESPSSAVESNFGGTWWYSSDDEDEDETETLFSSKSRSSDSSASHRRRKSRRRRSGGGRQSRGMGVLPLNGGKVKDSFAVVKKSSDPYNDFRSSMLEMIVEKQIFCVKDLEQLLQCFLSLNSHHHHRVILEVFTEIWEALFSDWWG